jgi:predicted small lipoprotein YifL
MHRRAILRLLLGTALLAAAAACGKKGPPTRPNDDAGKTAEPKKYKIR